LFNICFKKFFFNKLNNIITLGNVLINLLKFKFGMYSLNCKYDIDTNENNWKHNICCKSINNDIINLYEYCKEGILNCSSDKIHKAYSIYNKYDIEYLKNHKYYNEIVDILFHYEFSHGNIEKCENYLSIMNANTSSYQRHYIKYMVLKWWLYSKTDLINRNNDLVYKNIMNEIYKMMDIRREEVKTDRNAYLSIRDHIFYFKMGLYVNHWEKMKHKCIKWFRKCNYPKIYEQKLIQRIYYIKDEYHQYGKLYLGVLFDDIIDMDENIYKGVRFTI